MFRTVPLPIIRSFSLYPQQWYMSYKFADSWRAGSGRDWFRPDPARKLSANLYDIYHCCAYNEKLLMVDRGTVQFRPDPARKLSANLYDIYHCCGYNEKLLMMGRGTVRNM